MLVTLVACYFAVTICIGFYAARRVKNSADYLVAGRSLPLYMNTATVFATWFGAELILAVSSTFLKEGLQGVVGDPFGAAFCLIFVALFLAAPYYRLKLMTVGDFYKKRYNRTVELASAAAISISYLGWSSANLVSSTPCRATPSRWNRASCWVPSSWASTRSSAACGRWPSPTSSRP